MKKLIQIGLGLFVSGLLLTLPALAEEMSNDELSERVTKLEEKIKGGILPAEWANRITLSGAVEVEAGFEKMDFADPATADTDTSDLSLATAELGVEAAITEHVSGFALFSYDEDEGVIVDEAHITLDGGDALPLYVTAGKLYIPFGNFETHLISDPITLTLGEANEHALVAGYANDWFELCVAAYNGDVDKTGNDDHIEGFAGSATFTLPEGHVPGLGLALGASYVSNIADSDGLEGETPGALADYVGGVGAFVSVSYLEKFFFNAEYVGALDNFQAGELSFDGGNAAEPSAWYVELAYAPLEALELALRYEASQDLGDFEPETQYGAAVSYSIFENTAISLEYLHGEFENDDERELITAQLAIEF